jgi:hypothetical protein
MATKKKCTECGRVGKQVVARDSNTTAAKVGGRRCICRKGCK